MKQIGRLTHMGSNRAAVADVWIASTFLERAAGLLGKSSLPSGVCLWIVPCKSVHTWFMRFDIDVVFLNKDNQVLRIVEDVPAFRFVWAPKGTYSVLELGANGIESAGIKVGDMLRFE